MTFNPLKHPVCLEFPNWMAETAWASHIPFAMFLMSAARPKIFVELGSYRGVSYCAFCQAVKMLKAEVRCYAVDTWEGDEHAGKLEPVVLAALKAHHDPLYEEFSRLIQSTFDEALQHFDDDSIDLLHIDGFHAYDAVRHDFETWKQKISKRGIVLFHDINVRERGFGVWKLWEELKTNYPSFGFLHGHGLGVLAVGRDVPEEMKPIFEANETNGFLIREFFSQYGARIDAVFQLNQQKDHVRYLESYEKFVRKSRLMRFYRVFSNEGIGGVVKRM
ncbi:MAG: class I SAM-dependent methyltransferase [Blastocatellia bacterium]